MERAGGNDPSAGGEEPELLSDQIRNVLTDEIASGALPPGMGLDEQELANRFGASRTPVREALRQLAVTGLVEIRPRRGVIVTQTTPERIMEMFEMSAEIEAMCVRIATYRITPIERGRLIEMHDASEALVQRSDIDGYDKFNREFHEVIYGATHNAFMAEQALTIRNRLKAFRRTQLRHGSRLARSREEHEAILNAIAQGEGDEASRRMRAHMLNAASAIGRYIATQTRKDV
ncbi:GntR family transcriptional regulator [Bradyrhizobium jicamae]|uniref:GntR family transcriptional regulator n=1 Tax=Bradyrhizobium jicamae TaxID=280332 RepID=UPI002012147A|nr:GntR family transcriptional regulator [Bradyrhizobium jicamae]